MIRNYTGIILAGGKSSRMGKDKGLILFREKPLVTYPLDLLNGHCDEILISSGNPDYAEFGVPLVPDLFPDSGPMGGIYSAMLQASHDWCMLLACDMPFVRYQLLEILLEQTKNNECCIIPVHHGFIEPLAALYHRQIIPEMKKALEENRPSLYRLLQSSGAVFLNTEPLLNTYPDLFANINAPGDLET